jgi:DNA-binding transcriptional ArsR family regulator
LNKREDAKLRHTLERVAHVFRVLGDPARLQVFCALGGDELSAGAVEERTAIARASATRHLLALLEAKVVRRRRTGPQVLYRVLDARMIHLFEQIANILAAGQTAPASEELAIGLFQLRSSPVRKALKQPVGTKAPARRKRAV